jgi:multidrug transporter EmrE-like cation transporter
MWEHRHVLAMIRSDDYRYSERLPIAQMLGLALVVVGILGLALMLVQTSSPV